MTEAVSWHSRSLADIEEELGTDLRAGLSADEVLRRRAENGPNVLPEGKPEPLALVFLRQFASPLIAVLIVSAAVVALMGETSDALIIAAVLVFNAVIGTVQEGRAASTLRALKRFSETTATVLRAGEEIIVPDADLVPGDIIVLREGDRVPADARVVSANNLRIEEAALTGESAPVHKEETLIRDPATPVTAQRNMVFKGTSVLAGSGLCVVIATGARSVIGGISAAVGTVNTEIPLKKDIAGLSRAIIVIVAAASAALFAVGTATGVPAREMFAVVVSLAISIIPEGLPVILTLILATGVWRMAKRNALVKKLQAVEALGQASVIAVDKTGTLTENQMIVRRAWTGGTTFEIGGTGYAPAGDVSRGEEIVNPASHPELLLIGKIAAFTAGGNAAFDAERKVWRVAGDPTEVSMGVFGSKLGLRRDDLEEEYPLVADLLFDYQAKYHATVHRAEHQQWFIAVAGAPEAVVARSAGMTPKAQEELEHVLRQFSQKGLRVVALAYREVPAGKDGDAVPLEKLSFAGILGIEDSLRPEVADAVRAVHDAGVRLVMITGDHKITATAVAKEAGIWREGDDVLSGDDIEGLSPSELDRRIRHTTVFARVTPERKMDIIRAYRRRGEVVAMTGDGVNDAPSLVAADLGVAMGKIGTDVAKEAADIVLLDDNFGSIVAAIEEGRAMFQTIRKSIFFLFSTSVGELLAVAGGFFVGLPLPFLAPQILWMNLVTDPFMASALALEPNGKDLLTAAQKKGKRAIIDRFMFVRSAFVGGVMAVVALWLFSRYFEADLDHARTIALTVLAAAQWVNAWNCRSERRSAFAKTPSNPFLWWALAVSVVLHLFAVYAPVMQKVLHTVPLSAADWGIAIALALVVILAEEARKGVAYLLRRGRRQAGRSVV